MIEQIIQRTDLKGKVDTVFRELEEQAKARLMEELERALREKLQHELEKKAVQMKKKAKKHVFKALMITAAVFCSGILILGAGRSIPALKPLLNKVGIGK